MNSAHGTGNKIAPHSVLRVFLTALFLIASAAAALTAPPDYVAEGKRWWSHVQMLASDAMQGRNTGSEGFRKAAIYVAGEFERAGLKPAGTRGYSQSMTFNVRQIVEDESGLELLRGGNPETIPLGADATLGVRTETASALQAPLVFVGHGLVIPDANHDDLSGLDLQGKIAVFLAGGPPSIPGPLKSHYSSSEERWKALAKAGAVGTVSIANPKSMDIPWERSSLARLQPSMSVAMASRADGPRAKAVVTWNPARAEKLFAGSRYSFSELLALADSGKPLPRFELPGALRVKTTAKRWTVESQNVIGLAPGADPSLKDEYLVISAHLDHLGVGEPINGDKIYNGAMDDASGVASLIEIARFLRDENVKLRRSVLFVAVTGEEKGLQGSRYFASHPTVKGPIVADINMDMFLPLFPLKYLEVQGLGESTLGEAVKAASSKFGVEVQSDREPDRNRFIRSDQYAFILRGVPSLAFKFGFLKGSPEERTYRDWYTRRYHAPSDDLNQPVDKTAAARFNRLLLELVRQVANADERPRWYDSSFFRRFAR